MRDEKIAVTGGCGFLPSHLIDALKKEKPYCIKNLDIKNGFDVTKIGHMSQVLRGFDTVFHLATLPLPLSLTNPYLVASEIYLMSLTLCELCRQGVFKTLIQVSSSEVLNITTPYAAAKDAQDKLLTAYKNSFGIDAYSVMPFNTYGPGQVWDAIIPFAIKRILKGKRPIIHGTGEHSRDLVYVDDTIKGIIKRIPIITTGECYSVNEIVARISKLMKYKGKPIYIENRQGDTPTIHHSRTLNKYISLEEGLKRTIKWYSSHI